MRPTLPLLVVLSLLSLPGTAQRIALGLKGGLLASTTHAIHIQTFPVPGATAGIYIPYHAGPRFEIQPEALITLNGSGYQEPDGDRYSARTLYMNFPVSAKLFLGNSFNLQGGVKAGKLLMAYHETADGNVTVTDRYNSIDFGLTGGVGLDLPSGLDLTVRYYSGMKPILVGDASLFPRNRSLQFTAGYRLMHFREIKAVRKRR